MNNETEQLFLLTPSTSQQSSASQKIIIEIPETTQVNLENVEDFSSVCRTCATITEFVIPIFAGEGLQNSLADKIHQHLPIQVSEQDVLPRVVCYQCASTLLAWHELEACCRQADAALRSRLAPAAAQESKCRSIQQKSSTEDDSQSKLYIEKREIKIEANEDTYTVKIVENIEKPTTITVGEDGKRYGTCRVCNKTVRLTSWRRHARSHRENRRYSCHVCGLGFNDNGNLSRHRRASHAKQRPYSCPVCHKTFSRNDHLQDHVRSHSESREFVCDVCGKASKSSAALRMHRRTHDARRLRCVQCGARFRRRAELAAHASVHSGHKPHRCSCGRAFRLRSQLNSHARTHENQFEDSAEAAVPPAPPRYPEALGRAARGSEAAGGAARGCEFCSARLAETSYEAHLVTVHADVLFHCEECDKYVDRKDFILHMSLHAVQYTIDNDKADTKKCRKVKRRKRDEKTDSIGDADEVSPQKTEDRRENEFSDHSDTEYGFGPLPESVFEAIEDSQDSQPADEEPITAEAENCDTNSQPLVENTDKDTNKSHKKTRTCPICSKVYTASSSYFYHLKHSHNKSKDHECDVCGRKFGTKASLSQHTALHTGESPFECRECKKRFRSKASLYIHEQIHNGIKTWSCNQCHKSFRWRTHLLRHMKRHSAEKVHVCSVCGRGFSIRCDLLRHMRTHTAGDFTCEKCGHKFAQLRYLKVHMDKKHLEAEKESHCV